METREKVCPEFVTNVYICHIIIILYFLCVNVYYKLCRWILARYDVDVLDYYDTKQAVVDSAPLNEGVDILEFDYSRKEVEVRMLCL